MQNCIALRSRYIFLELGKLEVRWESNESVTIIYGVILLLTIGTELNGFLFLITLSFSIEPIPSTILFRNKESHFPIRVRNPHLYMFLISDKVRIGIIDGW